MRWSVKAVRAVIVKNMRIYWGMRNADRCSASPATLYIWVRYN